MLHLAVEKLLKALCEHTRDLAPRIHNLVRLAELAELALTQDQVDLLAELNAFNIEGRYPDLALPVPTRSQAEDCLRRTEEMYTWLLQRWRKQ